jgi:hypothetical protein
LKFEKRPKEKYNLMLRTKAGRKKLLWRTENFFNVGKSYLVAVLELKLTVATENTLTEAIL